MRIHHLSCGTMCPWGGNLMHGPVSEPALRRLVCHCLLIETANAGLVLVDTGFGQRDVQEASRRLSPFFMFLNRIQLHEEHTARRQVEALGFKADDVRHIVMTHLDFDHAGGLEDFPQARVHVLERELFAATRGRRGFIGRQRYRPRQWDDGVKWETYQAGGGGWMGFDCVRDLRGLPPEILIIPLQGHTWGHSGIAIQTADGWLLHAGDAYFYRQEIAPGDYRCPAGLRAYQMLMEVDRRSRLENQKRLKQLNDISTHKIDLFCSHDPAEYLLHCGKNAVSNATANSRATAYSGS